MATLTTYSTEDGLVYRGGVNETWATIRSSAGNSIDRTSADLTFLYIDTNAASSNQFSALGRAIYVFDTSSIGSGQTISSATFSLRGTAKTDTLGATPDINVYSATPASDTTLVAADYSQTGSTAFSTAITYAGFSTSGYNDWVLDSNGIANINMTGNSRFGVRNASYDVANSAPTWVSTTLSFLKAYAAEQTGTTNDPKLVVNYDAAAGATYRRLATLGVGQ